MTHPARNDWLSALRDIGPAFGVKPIDYRLKSPTFQLGGWKIAVEHLRNFESVVVGWPDRKTPMPPRPARWRDCPLSDVEGGWLYRVYLRPSHLAQLLGELNGAPPETPNIEDEFAAQVKKSLSESQAVRRARMANRSPVPERLLTKVVVFVRNPDVVVEVLLRAKGLCEGCGQPAPFVRRSDGSLYLEVHHKIRLADGGHDTTENAEALCPNCHRRKHYG